MDKERGLLCVLHHPMAWMLSQTSYLKIERESVFLMGISRPAYYQDYCLEIVVSHLAGFN
jgi:hypothetical protein